MGISLAHFFVDLCYVDVCEPFKVCVETLKHIYIVPCDKPEIQPVYVVEFLHGLCDRSVGNVVFV